MKYIIEDSDGEGFIKEAGNEILFLNRGDAIYHNSTLYLVDNKHIDYDKKIVTLWVEINE